MAALCMKCGGRLTVSESCFAGFKLLHCSDCDRSVKLIVDGPRATSTRPARRGDRNRMLRAARRQQMRGPLP